MALFVLWRGLTQALLVLLFVCLASHLVFVCPKHLDGAVFGPAGALAFIQGLVLACCGPLGSALCALWPSEAADLEMLAIVPSAAPLHVGGLLGAGFLDLSTDANWGLPPWLSLAALALGGLWSRRLGPHREIWSWDVVEITAVDLLGAEVISDHLWQKRPAPVGIAWGGGEVRLFRTGLAASHHHLSGTGAHTYGLLQWLPVLQARLGALGVTALVLYPRASLVPPLRIAALPAAKAAGAPLAAGEGSLAAWSLTLFAPSSGAIAAWGLWGGPFYLWLLSVPLFLYFRPLWRKAGHVLWLHYALVPLAHWFATPLPWAPLTLVGQAFLRGAR